MLSGTNLALDPLTGGTVRIAVLVGPEVADAVAVGVSMGGEV